jgi:hypothetical protein
MRRALVAAFVVSACGGASPPLASPTARAPDPAPLAVPPPPAQAALAVPESTPPEPTLTAIDRELFARAETALADGRLYAAKRIFAHLYVAYPESQTLLARFEATEVRIQETQRAAREALAKATPAIAEAPPATYALRRRAPNTGAVPRLVKESEERNSITDDDVWHRAAGPKPEFFVPPRTDLLFAALGLDVTKLKGFAYSEYSGGPRFLPTDMPAWVPLQYGTFPVTAIVSSKPSVVAEYGTLDNDGRVVAVFDASQALTALVDLRAYARPPASTLAKVKVGTFTATDGARVAQGNITADVPTISHRLLWAQAKDGVLYVSHSAGGYAKDAKGQTAYLTALDAKSGELLWRSQPLVANASTFVVGDGYVITGYGFTAEPDFMYVLDAQTGAVTQKLPVRSGPEVILFNRERVFVRCYDTNYVFSLKR